MSDYFPDFVFVLMFQYLDKSATYVCGATVQAAVANAWREAGNGEHKVYRIPFDTFKNATVGWKEWK